MRILVTNDDGIDSVGLHVLARRLQEIGDVIVVAPDREYSGFGAALGTVFDLRPEAHKAHIDGVKEAWSVEAPPALCAMLARLGAFDDAPDLIVSGINPGANVGRSVYHSGTVGACLTGRNGGISGIAISQAVDSWGIEGQGMDEVLANQRWDSAAEVAAIAAEAMLANMPAEPLVLNLNAPNLGLEEMKGAKRVPVGTAPPRSMGGARLEAKAGHEDSFKIVFDWGEAAAEGSVPDDNDVGAVMHGYVAMTWLSPITGLELAETGAEAAVEGLF